MYDITNKIRDTADRINGLERPKPNEGYALTNDISKISIRNPKGKVNSELSADDSSYEESVEEAVDDGEEWVSWENFSPIERQMEAMAQGVSGTYAMAGYATDSNGREFVAIVTEEQRDGNISGIEVYDVAHAVSGRQKNRSERVDTKSQGVYPSTNASKISIADFLNVVKSSHQSILSEDVLTSLGESRNPQGFNASQVKYSTDDISAMEEELQMRESQQFQDRLMEDGGSAAWVKNQKRKVF